MSNHWLFGANGCLARSKRPRRIRTESKLKSNIGVESQVPSPKSKLQGRSGDSLEFRARTPTPNPKPKIQPPDPPNAKPNSPKPKSPGPKRKSVRRLLEFWIWILEFRTRNSKLETLLTQTLDIGLYSDLDVTLDPTKFSFPMNLASDYTGHHEAPVMKSAKISELTTNRLSVYLRCLNELAAAGIKTISSQQLARQFHLNSAQIRKDLGYFGE